MLPTPAAAGAFLLKNWLPALLALSLIVQTVRIEGFGIWPLKIPGLQDKYDTAVRKLGEARAELERISTTKNEQRETTKQNVEKADKGDRKAREIADKIREAPIVPGKCETPGLDLLRNEI